VSELRGNTLLSLMHRKDIKRRSGKYKLGGAAMSV